MTRAQLLGAGMSASGIERRLQKGLLFIEFPSVYRLGHQAPSIETRYLAAVLACGDGSVLYGRAAAHSMRLVRGRPPEPEVLVRGKRRIPGIKTRRTRRIHAEDYWIVNGIRMTTVARTLVDLAGLLADKELARACHEAWVLYRTGPAQVEAVLARRGNSTGAAALRAALRGDTHVTLSEVEERFLALLGQEGLPLPQTNRSGEGGYVDCRWAHHRLVVELDSYRYHGSRHAWEKDHRRERLVRAAGDEFRRYTHDDVMAAPALMLRELGELLPS